MKRNGATSLAFITVEIEEYLEQKVDDTSCLYFFESVYDLFLTQFRTMPATEVIELKSFLGMALETE